MRDNVAWEPRRPACRLKEASGLSPNRKESTWAYSRLPDLVLGRDRMSRFVVIAAHGRRTSRKISFHVGPSLLVLASVANGLEALDIRGRAAAGDRSERLIQRYSPRH